MTQWFTLSSSIGEEVEEDSSSIHEADSASGGKDGEDRREAVSLVPGWTSRVAGAIDAAMESAGRYLCDLQHTHDTSGLQV